MCRQPGSKAGLQQAVALAGYEAGHLHPAQDLRPSTQAGIRHRRLQDASACGISLWPQRDKELQQWRGYLLAAQAASSMANTHPEALTTSWLRKPHLPWPQPSPQAR